MSSSLYWVPDVEPEGNRLSDELKFAISRHCWGTDGTMGEGRAILDDDDLDYLRGLFDAGIKDADTLIQAIEKHGRIALWHEY